MSSTDGPDEASVAAGVLVKATLDVALSSVEGPLVLAVSGGRDSMALMHAMARWMPARIAAVATFDHGTGEFATEACSLVAAHARRLGLTVVRERAQTRGHSEAAWRAARWRFLRRVARGFRARVATAHTRDDHLETIVMRLLRGTGTRGLAALAAASPVVRPWLALTRAELTEWVTEEGVAFLDDPMNENTRFQRTRVRHELLPALEAASPGVSSDLLQVAERAARWRREVDSWLIDQGLEVDTAGRSARVPAAVLEQTTEAGRAVIWPALAAYVGATLDATGTREAVRFTTVVRRGAQCTLAGQVQLLRWGRGADEFLEVRRASAPEDSAPAWHGVAEALPSRIGRWRFQRLRAAAMAGEDGPTDTWCMALPAGQPVVVRSWEPGDRIRTVGAPAGRRVTRYFSESRIPVPDRRRWPMVLVDGVPTWVPGVCRAVVAPTRPDRSDLIWYRCEREFV